VSTLYVVATPIGNLSDVSPRAIETLSSVDAILCEDTRVTSKLLAAAGIRKTLIAYHQHSDAVREADIVARLARGESLALVTDAGTPGISDPGGRLVKRVADEFGHMDESSGMRVAITPIPGPNAAIAALSVSGFPCDEFVYLGFPPHKRGRQGFFRRLASIESTVVFYESTHRILKTLEEARRVAGAQERKMVVCRELTKLHETIYRGTVDEVIRDLDSTSTKGEFVVVFGPMTPRGAATPPITNASRPKA
jgi:16S rRNA (cytidine1402-2'-O)-methyltransferase